jgi:hypothetical protein
MDGDQPRCVRDKICLLNKVTGPCKAYMPRFWYNVITNTCEKFIYGGCDGNENRFNTIAECQKKCQLKDV